MPFLLAGHRSSSNMSSLRQIFASIWFLAKTESSRQQQQQQQHLNDTSLRALKINRFKTTTNKSSAAASGSHTVAMKSFAAAAAAAKSSSRRKSRLGVSSDSLAVAVAVGFVIYILVLCSSLLTCTIASRARGGSLFMGHSSSWGGRKTFANVNVSVCPRLCFKGSFRDENLCSKRKTSVYWRRVVWQEETFENHASPLKDILLI